MRRIAYGVAAQPPGKPFNTNSVKTYGFDVRLNRRIYQ